MNKIILSLLLLVFMSCNEDLTILPETTDEIVSYDGTYKQEVDHFELNYEQSAYKFDEAGNVKGNLQFSYNGLAVKYDPKVSNPYSCFIKIKLKSDKHPVRLRVFKATRDKEESEVIIATDVDSIDKIFTFKCESNEFIRTALYMINNDKSNISYFELHAGAKE